jgi:hypothetical protein
MYYGWCGVVDVCVWLFAQASPAALSVGFKAAPIPFATSGCCRMQWSMRSVRWQMIAVSQSSSTSIPWADHPCNPFNVTGLFSEVSGLSRWGAHHGFLSVGNPRCLNNSPGLPTRAALTRPPSPPTRPFRRARPGTGQAGPGLAQAWPSPPPRLRAGRTNLVKGLADRWVLPTGAAHRQESIVAARSKREARGKPMGRQWWPGVLGHLLPSLAFPRIFPTSTYSTVATPMWRPRQFHFRGELSEWALVAFSIPSSAIR